MRGFAVSSLARIVVLHGLLIAPAVEAHHSGAVFDAQRIIELRGVVVAFNLRSPHSSFVVDARAYSEDGVPLGGDVARWEVESESVPVLRSYGVDASTFEPGDSCQFSRRFQGMLLRQATTASRWSAAQSGADSRQVASSGT